MDLILNKNKGFKTFLKTCNIINGEYKTEEKDVNITLNSGQIASFKYMLQQHCVIWKGVSANINL